jgi:hypothetical protein
MLKNIERRRLFPQTSPHSILNRTHKADYASWTGEKENYRNEEWN